MGRRIYIRPEISRIDDDGTFPRMNEVEGKRLQRQNAWDKAKIKRRRMARALAHLRAENKRLKEELQKLRKQLHGSGAHLSE